MDDGAVGMRRALVTKSLLLRLEAGSRSEPRR